MRLRRCEAILVTHGEHGMTLVPRNGEAVHVPAFAAGARRLRPRRHRRRTFAVLLTRAPTGTRVADRECGGTIASASGTAT